MTVIRPTQNPFTFKPTGNTTVRAVFTKQTPPPPADTCQSYKIQSTEANLTQFGGGQLNPTVSVRYTACGGFAQSTVVTLRRTGIPIGNSIEYAAYICSTTKPEVFSQFVSVSPPASNTSLCTSPPPQTTLTIQAPLPVSGTLVISNGNAIGDVGRDVTVRATPATGFRFTGWLVTKNGVTDETNEISVSTFNERQINVDVNTVVGVKFERQIQLTTITTTVSPDDNAGTVSLQGQATGESTRTVRLTAAPKTGFRFLGWTVNSQPISSTQLTLDVLADVNKTVVTRFEQIQSQLTITANPTTVVLRRASSVEVPLVVTKNNIENVTFNVTGLPTNIAHEIVDQTTLTPRIIFRNSGQTTSTSVANVTISGTNASGQNVSATAQITINGTFITRLVPLPSSNGRVNGTSNFTTNPVAVSGTGIIELESAANTSITLNAIPSNAQYRFGGWFLNDNLNTAWRTGAAQTVTVASNATYTAKFEQITGGSCTAPPGPFERIISVTCPTNTTGTATQRQTRTYDANASTTGVCPYTPWVNDGSPDISSCVSTQNWRNCVTGELSPGTAPSDYVQIPFNGAGGGFCWEPAGDIAFLPSLSEALRFTYQRGSASYPTSKSVQVTNTSNSRSRRVTIQTNSNVNLSTGVVSGNGNISFVLAPRASVTLSVNVTPQLLQELADGVSTLNMNIQYQVV